MADKDSRLPDNVPGRFYVDDQWIDCDACRETAPDFFTRNDERGYSFVHRQPETESDVEQCMEALEGCPVEAIGIGLNNGRIVDSLEQVFPRLWLGSSGLFRGLPCATGSSKGNQHKQLEDFHHSLRAFSRPGRELGQLAAAAGRSSAP